jgi:outer membrane protein insertion porin family
VGNRSIDTDVVQQTVALDTGAPLRSEDLLRARTRAFGSGLFRRVDIDSNQGEGVSPDAATVPTDVRVTVEEWPALRFRYGVQVAEAHPESNPNGTELVPGLTTDLVRRTVFGRAMTVGGAFQVERREQLARGFVNTPTLFGLPVASSLVFDRSRETFEALTLVSSRTGATWEQRTRVLGNLNLSYAYRFERNRTFDTEPDPGVPLFDITVNVGRLTGSAAWDTRDDPADTTRGLLVSSSLEYAPEALGSDIAYVRELAQAYYFRPVGNTVLASAARFGIVTPLGGQELLQLFRFFAGGSRTVRGVAEDGLGEVDFFGDPRGGRTMLVLNQEVRVPLYRWVRGVAFVDAGNVFSRFADLRFGDLVGSIGAGLRIETPFALLRVDYGKAVWSVPEGASGRWTFGIGHVF